MKLLRIIFIPLLFTQAVCAQHIQLLSVDEGLPQSFVSGIAEDQTGFVWIGTRNGLARYDGHDFKVFQNIPNLENTISSNFIDYIRKGTEDMLYIRYDGGEIDIFNTLTEEVTPYITKEMLENDAINASKDSWSIDLQGNFLYLEASSKVVQYTPANAESSSQQKVLFEKERIVDFYEDQGGILWILTNSSIVKFDRQHNTYQEYPFSYSISNTASHVKALLHQRTNGELIWSSKERLYIFNKQTTSFRYINLPETSPHNIKWISTAPDGKEYFESNRNIYSYDDVLGLQQRASINVGEKREIRAFMVDASGLIWVGANTEGVYMIDLAMHFESFVYQEDFLVDLLKEKYGFTHADLFGLEIKSRTGLSPSYYFRSKRTEQGLWMVLNRSVVYFDFGKASIERLPDLEPLTGEDPFAPIKGITITAEGYPLVIDQDNAMYLYDLQTKSWKALVTTSLFSEAGYSRIIPNDMIYLDQKLWITTESTGLLIVDIVNNSIDNLTKAEGLPTDNLFGIVKDVKNDDIIWVASPHGLIQISKQTLAVNVFSTEEGFPDNVIYSILPDPLGYLWLGTNRGLTRFHTSNHSLRTFTKSHGLPNLEFNRFHSLELPDGNFAFGGISRGVIFNPRFIQEDGFSPNIIISRILINNAKINEDIDDRPFHSYTELNLPYDKNTLSFEFSALQFSQPQDILYRYRLENYDKDWVYIKNKRTAVYTKIPPGKYTFEVNATNTSGVWSPHTKTINISISPPFWNTFGAKISYILFIATLVYFYIRYTTYRKVTQNKIALKNKEAENLRQLDESKTHFFSNITHELRTPLSLIIGPAEILLKGEADKAQQNKLISVIYKNAENLLKLSNQLLDIAKLEAGVLKPQMLWGDVVSVIKKMVNSFSAEAAQRDIKIILEAPERTEYLFSPNTLERILSNLISNALKFSKNGDEIHVILSCESEGITLVVKDNGKGIPKEELSNIFKRFYKAHTNGNIPGTGIGLSLVRELVDIHKGIITVESNTVQPSGTTFTIFLPFDKRPEEKEFFLNTINDQAPEAPVEINGTPLILIVEDNEELASFLSLSLQKSYRILHASDGNEGLTIASKHLPDLIISDVLMDGMDGFEFCETLKKDINLNHIPTLLLTAKSDMSSKLKGLSLGADDYITKPFNVSELVMRIENKLELQAYQRNFFYKKFKLLPTQPENYVLEKEHVNNAFLENIQDIIDKHLENEKFGVEDLAFELHMSRASLHRKVKSMTNLSTGEIIKTHKLKRAVEYLNQGLNISEVAYKTGFASPSYFSKCFKETYYFTPTEYLQKQALQQNL